MRPKLKVAAVGSGYFSQFHYDAWSRCPEVNLVGVADLDPALAEKVADAYHSRPYGDVGTMLQAEKPDILDVITPPQTHLEMINRAADLGVHVVCQKPFCGNIDDAKMAVDIGEGAGIDVIVHENFRFQPWYRLLKRELERNHLGRLYRATFRIRPGDGQGVDAYLDRQPYFQKMERFLIHETAIHFVDVFRYLLGEPTAVWADLSQLNPVISGEDSCLVVMDFENGLRGVVDGNRLSDHIAENRRRTMGELSIEGEKGELVLDGEGAVYFRPLGSNENQRVEFGWNDRGFGGDSVYLFTRHVVDHFISGVALENTGRQYLANLAVEEAIYDSAETGKWVSITPG